MKNSKIGHDEAGTFWHIHFYMFQLAGLTMSKENKKNKEKTKGIRNLKNFFKGLIAAFAALFLSGTITQTVSASAINQQLLTIITDVRDQVLDLLGGVWGVIATMLGIISLVVFIIKVVSTLGNYRKGEELDWKSLIIPFASVIICFAVAAINIAELASSM